MNRTPEQWRELESLHRGLRGTILLQAYEDIAELAESNKRLLYSVNVSLEVIAELKAAAALPLPLHIKERKCPDLNATLVPLPNTFAYQKT